MAPTKRLRTATTIWIAIVYVACHAGVTLVPGIRPAFVKWALHMEADLGSNVMTLGTFAAGLAIWEFVALVGVGLFAGLYNRMR